MLGVTHAALLADIYDFLTTDQEYEAALSPREAQEELKRRSGSLLDPKLVEAFLAAVNDC